jgi:hypothetical protein
MKTRHCDECQHYSIDINDDETPCDKEHSPRWYKPKNDNPHDPDYGYKRKCGDYLEKVK